MNISKNEEELPLLFRELRFATTGRKKTVSYWQFRLNQRAQSQTNRIDVKSWRRAHARKTAESVGQMVLALADWISETRAKSLGGRMYQGQHGKELPRDRIVFVYADLIRFAIKVQAIQPNGQAGSSSRVKVGQNRRPGGT